MPAEFQAYVPDIYPFLIAAAILGAWAWLRPPGERGWRIIFWVVAGMGMLVAVAMLAGQVARSPSFAWCGGRLAPAISIVKGYELYYPADHGPILVQMYGPISALVYLPAALASRPTGAMLIGTFISMAMCVVAAGSFLLSIRRGGAIVYVVAGLVAFVLIGSRQFVLAEALTRVTIDGPALGFAALAMAVMVGRPVERFPGRAILCGILAACSIWTKLTFAPLAGAIIIYAFLVAEPRAALRFTILFSSAAAGVTLILLLWLGTPLLFQNIVIPASQPWRWPGLPRAQAYMRAMGEILSLVLPVPWVLVVAVVVSGRAPRFNRTSIVEWSRQNPWILPALMAILVLPTATLAYVKIGGIWNNAAASTYPALLAAIAALVAGCSAPTGRAARVALAVLLLGYTWIGSAAFLKHHQDMHAWETVAENDHEQACQFAQAHPSQAWFPAYPLATLMAEDRLYHFTAGLESASWGGHPPDDEHLRAHLPSDMRYIIFRIGYEPEILGRFPEFRHEVSVPELTQWRVLSRDPVNE